MFVYGTLRKDFGLTLLEPIADEMVVVGLGIVSGTLYDLGPYPAAVKTAGTHRILGDVYEIKNPAAVFALLDQYEGEAYQREVTRVKWESGDDIDAFVYWYTGHTDKAKRIEGKDYLEYLKNKKDRFA